MRTINSLDPSQKAALESVVNGQSDSMVIYGPPGTGKSHLIVSLLFELATKGKSVLFVSQNSEALNVIVRMYKSLHKELGLSDQDLSFLDFCWRLNSSEQKRLKYLRNIFNVRTGKTTQNVNYVSNIPNGAQLPPYNLTYTELDPVKNYNVQPNELGPDELVSASLKYLTPGAKASSTLHNYLNVDIRGIFKLITDFKDPDNNFANFNHPTNQLKFFAKDNDQLTLGPIRMYADTICSLSDIIKQQSSYLSLVETTTVQRYLDDLRQIANISQLLDVNQIAENPKLLQSIETASLDLIRLNNSKYNVKKIDIPDDFNYDAASKYKNELLSAKTSQELSGLAKERESLERKIKPLIQKFNFDQDAKIDDLITSCLKTLDFDYRELFSETDIEAFMDLNETTLSELITDIKAFNKKGKMSQFFSLLPMSIRKFANTESSAILGNEDFFQTILDTIAGTGIDIRTMDKAAKRKISVNFNPIDEVDQSCDNLVKLTNFLLKIQKATPARLIEKNTVKEILLDCDIFRRVSKTIIGITEKENIEYSNTWDVAELINQNSLNQSIESKINSYYSEYRNIFKNNAKEHFLDEAQKLLNYMSTNGNILSEAIARIGNIPKNTAVDTEKITELEEILKKTIDENIYSHDFYTIKQNENLLTWQKRISTILDYGNFDEFEAFTSQMSFIRKIKDAITPANLKILYDLLSEDGIDYDTFAEHLINDTVSSSLYNMPKSAIQKIPKNYFKDFKETTLESRRLRYLKELSGLRANCAKEAQQLSYFKSWYGNSTMEKIRNNTVRLIKTFPIVIATPNDVSKYVASLKGIFNYVIFDEASQLLPGQALPSIYRAEKAIIVGDPHQMPPTSVSMIGATATPVEDEDEEIGESILDMAVNLPELKSHHLKIHYRSESNKLFEPSLTAIYNHDGIRPIFEAKSDNLPIYIEDRIGEDNERGFSAIIKRIEHYLHANPNASFCVLFSKGSGDGSLYEFKKYLETHPESSEKVMEMYEEEKILMSTVTNCQGIQGHHTIIYLPSYNVISKMWFFNEKAGAYKRLNVSITRQTKTLDIIMGNSKTEWIGVCQSLIQAQNTPPNTLLSANLLNSLLTNAGQAIDEEYLDHELSKNVSIIDSPLTQGVYDKLTEHYQNELGKTLRIWCEVGWNILIPDPEDFTIEHKNVGYRIDIGVYSIAKKRFILGIEMDGSVYHRDFDKDFSDLQRQETLERKGWKLYRIWSPNWLRDPNKEFENLISVIDEELKKEDPVAVDHTDDDVYEPEAFTIEEDDSASEPIAINAAPIIDTTEDSPAETIKRSETDATTFELELIKEIDRCARLGLPIRINTDSLSGITPIYIKNKEFDGITGSEKAGGAIRKYKYNSITEFTK